ncbi:MAG: hypothetical protein ACRC1K_15450 [Planctomycetia bacterium]
MLFNLFVYGIVFIAFVLFVLFILVVTLHVHHLLGCLCVRHASRYCGRRGLRTSRGRWRPEFDASGIKTELIRVQLDCFDPQQQRRLVTLLVWPFGVWKQISDEAYPDPDDLEWPPELAESGAPSDAERNAPVGEL